jgi:hypothetical protein
MLFKFPLIKMIQVRTTFRNDIEAGTKKINQTNMNGLRHHNDPLINTRHFQNTYQYEEVVVRR